MTVNEVAESTKRQETIMRPGHVPALDGYRGLGLIGMLLYHHGVVWAQGAIFMVSTFFTMSGFLITTLLIHERVGSGRVNLRAFWVRRFRRLLPAAIAALSMVVLFGAVFADQTQRAGLRTDVLAAFAYVANWRFILGGTAYLDAVSSPSPVLHFWSLAIEEQFYLLFPILVIAIVGRRRQATSGSDAADSSLVRRRLFISLGALLLITVSLPFVFEMSQNRIYLGTDTRAPEILVGCLLAVFFWGRHRLGDQLADGPLRRAIRVAAPIALVGALTMWVVVPKTAPWIYRGGFAAYTAVSAVLVIACLDRSNVVASVFSMTWMRWLGERAYGIYLIHFPLFMVLTTDRTGLGPWALFGVRVGVSVALAALMYQYLESPLRLGRPLFGQPLDRLASIAIASVLVMLVVTTHGAEPGTISVVAAGADSLRVPRSATRDSAPVAPVVAPPSTVAPASTVPTAPPGGLVPVSLTRPSRTLRMMLVGDSSALFLGYALNDWSEQNGVFSVADYGLMGCPLVTAGTELMNGFEAGFDPKCAQWPQIWSNGIQETKPDLIVVGAAFHDIVDRRLAPDGAVQHVGQPAFDSVLADTYRRLVDLLSVAHVPILWLDNPPVRAGQNQPDRQLDVPDNDPARMEKANQLIRQLAEERPEVTVVPYSNFFLSWPGGPFDPRLREDGLHVDFEGRAIVANWLSAELLANYWRAIES